MDNRKKIVFVVGTQLLYGEKTIKEVQNNSQIIVDYLQQYFKEIITLELMPIVSDSNQAEKMIKEINYDDNIIGAMFWMHTFSPGKMWINGLKKMQKPLLHFATQFYEEIPWDDFSMDYMNTHQSAHADKEFSNMVKRLNLKVEVVFGYWKNNRVLSETEDWIKAAIAYSYSGEIRIARLGDNMKNVVVTEGDKIEYQIKFGWIVDTYNPSVLDEYIEGVQQVEVDAKLEEYREKYILESSEENYIESIREQAIIEIAINEFLDDNDYNAFTTNFENLGNLKQLPGLAVQNLVDKGYGFAAEGDWKTAGLNKLIKLLGENKSTGFVEDYTYNLSKGSECLLYSHMLEVDPGFSDGKPEIKVHPLDLVKKNSPARLVFPNKIGDCLLISILNDKNQIKILSNEQVSIKSNNELRGIPVGYVLTKPKNISLFEYTKEWHLNGGGHHSVLSFTVKQNQINMLAKMLDVECINI